MKKVLLSIFCCLLSIMGYAQQDTEFWFAAPYINCEHGSDSPYRLVIFAFEESAYVTISMPANPDFTPITVQIAANDHANIVLANNKWEGDEILTTPFNQKSNRGLLITSTSKIECYYQIDGNNSEAFTLKGKNALGTDFMVVGQKSYRNGNGGDQAGSCNSVHIVATENNTLIRFIPICELLDVVSGAGDTIDVLLQKGETYAFAAASNESLLNLAGSRIVANAPIAVTMNDDSVTPDDYCADDIGEQLVSTDFAGMNFIVVAEGNRHELCMVFALEDNTKIITSKGGVYTINENEYQAISLADIQVMSIQTSQPVMLFQVVAVGEGGELGGTIVPQIECTGSMIAGYMPFSSYYQIYINLITRKTNINNFTINNEKIPASCFSPVDSLDEYYFARIERSTSHTPYVVRCSSGIFQMGVSEGSSSGSNTYGFFSDYAEQIPMNVEANGTLVYSDYYVGHSESLKLLAYSAEGFEVTDVAWTLPNGTIIYNDSIIINQVTAEYIGEYVVTANTAMCGVMKHRFNILYHQEVTIEDTFCEGSVYTWENHYEDDGITPMTFAQAGTYRDTLVSNKGIDSICVLQLSEIPLPILLVRPDTTIQLGDSVLLWAAGADYIHWISDDYLTQTDELSYYAKPLITTQYTVTGYNMPDSGANVVYNGTFDEGNVGFYTDCNYFEPYTYPGSYGTYTIADDVQGFWMSHVPSIKAYGGNGNMMILDGKTTANSIVWQQTVNVKPNTYYAFSAQVMSALDSYYEGQYALLQFAADDQNIGPIFHSPDERYVWKQFYNMWYSGQKTSVTLTIYNQNDNYSGNDFAIDEIEFVELYGACQVEETVTITVDLPSLVDTVICQSDLPFKWNGLTVDSAGVYQTTVVSSTGKVDSIATMVVTLAESHYTDLYDTICFGNTYEWNSILYTESGSYTDTLSNIYGCDSLVTLHLTILPEVPVTECSVTIPFGESYTWNGTDYTATGDYTLTLSDVNSCDSLVILHLTVLPNVSTTEESATICYGDSISWNGVVYTQSGDYTQTLKTDNGGDSILILHLTVLPEVPLTEEFATLCYGDSISWNGDVYSASGDYTVVLSDMNGCDSVATLHLIILPEVPSTEESVTICYGDSYIWNSVAYTASGVYTLTLADMNGCDSVATLHLTVLPEVPLTEEFATLCYGDSISWNGNIYSATGDYTYVSVAANGCDSVVVLHLTVLPEVPLTEESVTICYGESYTWNGEVYSVSGDYTLVLSDINGCDSVATLHLTILSEVPLTEEYVTICYGDSLAWNGSMYASAGDYTVVLSDMNGCDSVATLHLNILPEVPLTEEYAIIVSGESYTWNGDVYTEDGDYTLVLSDVNGCDSVVVLHLDVRFPEFSIAAYEQCADDPYVEFELLDYIDFDHLAFEWDENAHAQGIRDTIVEISGNYISIPNAARAGVYTVQISAVINDQNYKTQSHTVTLLYPSSVLDQHWDDFIAVLTHDYNGGYDFVSFQWYKNNEPLSGETKSYISGEIEMGASYSALLEDVNGIKLMTCPIEVTHKEEISIYPSVLTPRQIIHVYTSECATIELYTMTGDLLLSGNYDAGNIQLQAPSVSGLYIIKVIPGDEPNKVLTRKITIR